ncbi:MAG TPA: hypothetical protein VFT22_03810, partial [Kofleriaceae bacterium]|nr:hypothetical protein [Kofleriaceae bacterium]
ELRLPPASYLLEASHPRFAGIGNTSSARLAVEPGDRVRTTLTLVAGCAISGRVVDHAGRAAGDGAIERQWGQGDFEFAPAGRIEPDGTFRWVTTDEGDVTLRAWPWKSPPSNRQRFTCRDGARFDDVVFQLIDRRPDVSGVLLDHDHRPVGATYVDLQPLDRGGVPQQERSDASGRWEVYDLPPGRYRAIAQTADRGIAEQIVESPSAGIQLELRGTGRLEGTTRLASGSFEVVLGTCIEDVMISLPQSRRMVTVSDGRFAIDGLPACKLTFQSVWHGHTLVQHAEISSGQAAHLALDLGGD